MKSLICLWVGWLDTLFAGGYWRGFRIEGHVYGEPVYTVVNKKIWDEVPTEEYLATVELETLTCERCGDKSEGWRRMP